MTFDDRFQGVGEGDDFAGDHSGDDHLSSSVLESPQDFEDYWSEELVILYHALIDKAAGSGWRLFERLDFCEFCKFAYVHSSLTKDPFV